MGCGGGTTPVGESGAAGVSVLLLRGAMLHHHSEVCGGNSVHCARSLVLWLFAAADGVEYENNGGHNTATFGLPNGDGDAACTVCQRPAHQQTYVQWGRSSSCSNGHTTEYTGLVMASHYTHSKSEYVCVDRERAVHSRSSGANENGGLLYFTEMERGSADEVYPHNREVGCSVCSVRSGTGSVYSHWGSTTCPSGAEVLYSGFMATSHYTHGGSGANMLCMHPSPQYPAGYSDGDQNGALLCECVTSCPFLVMLADGGMWGDHDPRRRS